MQIPVVTPEMRQYVLELPWTEFVNQKNTRRESINLNLYRNLYYRALSAQKNNFQARISKLIKQMGIPPLGKVWLHYEIHPNSLGRVDTMNVGSIEDKFFSDTLTKTGVIEDDDYTKVVFNSFCFGYVSKGSPFVKVTIIELEIRKQPNMRVLLDEHDIQTALEAYVTERGINGATGVKLSTEGGQFTAEVLFGIQASSPKTVAPVSTGPAAKDKDEDEDFLKPKSRGGRPTGSKNKPKEASEDVGASGQGGFGRDDEGIGQASGGASDDDEDFPRAKTKGGDKNPSGDSQEESSSDGSEDSSDPDAETVRDEETAKPVTAKKSASSIFDDD